MSDYPKSHPLWNRPEEWIAQRAAYAVHTANKVPHGAYDVLIRADAFAAVVHMARLESERADRAEAQLKIEAAELRNQETMRAQAEDEASSANIRAKTAEARALAASSIITDLQLHMDPNAIGDSATEAFERAMEWLTEAPV